MKKNKRSRYYKIVKTNFQYFAVNDVRDEWLPRSWYYDAETKNPEWFDEVPVAAQYTMIVGQLPVVPEAVLLHDVALLPALPTMDDASEYLAYFSVCDIQVLRPVMGRFFKVANREMVPELYLELGAVDVAAMSYHLRRMPRALGLYLIR